MNLHVFEYLLIDSKLVLYLSLGLDNIFVLVVDFIFKKSSVSIEAS